MNPCLSIFFNLEQQSQNVPQSQNDDSAVITDQPSSEPKAKRRRKTKNATPWESFLKTRQPSAGDTNQSRHVSSNRQSQEVMILYRIKHTVEKLIIIIYFSASMVLSSKMHCCNEQCNGQN